MPVSGMNLLIEQVAISSLKPAPINPRIHSRKQIRQIRDSIKEFGFNNPVLIDADSSIIAGHGRVQAAQLLGFEAIPAIRIGHLNEQQRMAFLLADNKIAVNAGWDPGAVALILQDLAEFDFDLSLTGFDTPEIDYLLESAGSAEGDDPAADAVPEPDASTPPVSRLGDRWLLGPHRLLCGDATSATAFETLMASESAQMVFIDPPYNVPIDGHVCGLGAIKHREFVMASGEMSEAEFIAFLARIARHLIQHSGDGSIHYICMDWRHAYELLAAARPLYGELKNICVWNKTNAGMGTFYRSKHELVLVFKSGTQPHINNFELGQHGRTRTNVWDYMGVNALGGERLSELRMHPTVKPVALVADAIKDCSRRNGIVLDSFVGSGTTVIAAEKTGRRAYAMEIDPHYVDTAVRRWQEYTGETAVHAETGRSFAELAGSRARDAETLPSFDAHSGMSAEVPHG